MMSMISMARSRIYWEWHFDSILVRAFPLQTGKVDEGECFRRPEPSLSGCGGSEPIRRLGRCSLGRCKDEHQGRRDLRPWWLMTHACSILDPPSTCLVPRRFVQP